MKKVRNNSLIIKRSLEKTISHLERVNGANAIITEQNKKKKEFELLLASLDEMSYTDLRKKAQEAGIPIYQRKKESLKEDLRNYYEQYRPETY